ncbi:MAG: hypothetical protein ABSB10_01720 [Candidatus Bathyarchaeia archaeon]|jgi:hypothetical protein
MGCKLVYSLISTLRNKKVFSILSIAILLLSYLLVFNLQTGVRAQVTEQFDDCDSLTNTYGSWGSTYGALSIGTSSPAQGTGYVEDTLTNVHDEYLSKTCFGWNFWDFSSNPILTFQVRASAPVYAEFDVITATGSSMWETASIAVPTQFTAGQWVTETIDLRTMINQVASQPIDLTKIRQITIYLKPEYQSLTVDIDNIQANPAATPTPTPFPTPTPSPSPTPTPNPNQTVYCTFNLTMTATVLEPVYEEANITKIIQASWIANDGTLYAGSFATLYRSFDQGVTWQPLITFNSSNAAGIDCMYVNELNYIFTSPDSNATANELGLWKSIDGGGNWSKVLSLPLDCSILSMDEDSNGNLFAGIYTTGSTGNASICKSTDGGDHWQTVYYDSAARHVHDVTVDKSNNYIYASIGDLRVSPWNITYVIRSTDDGNNWTQILAGIPQIIAIEAIPGARLLATDLDNGIIYRTTDDVSYNGVLDTGAQSYGFWFSANNLNGNIYASFIGGESTNRNAGIYISNDSGLTWNVYKIFNIHNAYFGSTCGSNFFQGTMYYSVLLDSGWQNGIKIYSSFGASPNQVESAVNLNMPTETFYNDSGSSSASNDSSTDAPAVDLSQLSFISTQWFPLSLGSIAVSTAFSLDLFTFQNKRPFSAGQKVVNHGYRFQGSNHNSKSIEKGGEKI